MSNKLNVIARGRRDIAALYKKSNSNFKYCTIHKCFYNYDYKNNVWYSISVEDVKFLLLDFIKSKYPKLYKTFNPQSVEGVIVLLHTAGSALAVRKK